MTSVLIARQAENEACRESQTEITNVSAGKGRRTPAEIEEALRAKCEKQAERSGSRTGRSIGTSRIVNGRPGRAALPHVGSQRLTSSALESAVLLLPRFAGS
jgi:hypothetical protein